MLRFLKPCLVAVLLLLCFVPRARAYSVLTHEQIVDMAWHDYIVPLLRQRFPNTTPEQLKQAHAYAYGGCLIQDMGYYPFGNHHFSDLVHYVRSGDFVLALLREARDVNEYAFALGALAHYAADVSGHPAVNRSVAIVFPRLRARYGDRVTYEDDPKAHIRTEFGFDVVQVGKNRYTSNAYHDFIGFEVAQACLERAFRDTYGIELKDVIAHEDLTIGSFRWAISRVIPTMTKVALKNYRAELVKEYPTFSKKKFLYHLSRAGYEREWGRTYQRPGFGTRLLAFLVRLLPKVGPFKAAKIITPTPQTENLYLKSVDDSLENYHDLLRRLALPGFHLDDRDFDTGLPTRPGEYKLTDETYAHLVHQLAQRHFDLVTPALRDNILRFYANRKAPDAVRQSAKKWAALQGELQQLQNVVPAAGAR